MKIGELARLNNVTIDTIRHYISIGLLIPHKNGSQYDFSLREAENLQYIQKLKSMRFHLKEIEDIMNLRRTSNWVEPETMKQYIHMLQEKSGELAAEQVAIKGAEELVAKEIREFEETGKGTYLFGMEESYGCLIGTYARDKDAIVATMALCEAAAYYKTQGKTLWDAMIEMYEQFGYYKDDIKAVTMKGIEGLQKIQDIMNSLRQNPPAEFAGHKVVAVRDYKADTIKNLETGEVTPTGLPNSNVLYYELTNDAWVCVRPSGTEPKVKFYYGVKGTSLADADEKSAVMGKAVLDMVDSMM